MYVIHYAFSPIFLQCLKDKLDQTQIVKVKMKTLLLWVCVYASVYVQYVCPFV